MVYVPAGSFLMGSSDADPLATSEEKPQHTVTLDAFWIDKTEVTLGMYALCVDRHVCHEPIHGDSPTRTWYWGNPEFLNYPVTWVNWNMAQTYCEWAGRRLPTEAEWEKAARGTVQQTYPWGQTFDASRANSCDANCPKKYANKNFNDNYGDTAPVDAFPNGVSMFGALNLSGNVSEWVADWYSAGYYSSSSSTSNPPGPQNGEKHILRGGSWLRFPINLRLVTRSSQIPDYTSNDVGFRCVSSIP